MRMIDIYHGTDFGGKKRDSVNAPFPKRCIKMTHEWHNSGIINDPSSEFSQAVSPMD